MILGVDLAKIVPRSKTTLKALGGRVIAIDAYNTLYQFLSIIRDYKGQPLKDGMGRVTSHLSGLFYRNINLLEDGIRPIYVFDGIPPSRKNMELERRKRIKEESREKYKDALAEGRFEEAKRHAMATASLEEYMAQDAKRLLRLLGIPYIEAPSEGEAQAGYLVLKGDAWASGSQDYDSLLFGSPRAVRNITLTGKQHYPSRGIAVKLEPEIIELEEVLSKWEITRAQLVDIGILVGTDFNSGVKGIGPVKALELVKKYGRIEDIPQLEGKIDLGEVAEIREIFLNPEITDDYVVQEGNIDREGVIRFLCGERDFSEERVTKALEKVVKGRGKEQVEGRLDQWLG
jgi:flap endonuclease-1